MNRILIASAFSLTSLSVAAGPAQVPQPGDMTPVSVQSISSTSNSRDTSGQTKSHKDKKQNKKDK
ncbi:MAG: hypothetical protein AAF512_21085 [Pseudomonadota bacterium]